MVKYVTQNELEKIVNNRLKTPKNFFDWCKGYFPIYEWENKKKKIVSSERKTFTKVIKKRLSLNSRLSFFSENDYFTWIGITNKRIEYHLYEVCQMIEDGKETFSIKLLNFYQLANNRQIKASIAYGRVRSGYTMHGPFFYRSTLDGYLYNDMKDVVKKLQTISELKYLDFNEICGYHQNLKDSRSIKLNLDEQLPHLYKYRDRIEYAQKLGAKGLVKDMVGVFGNTYTGKAQFIHANMNKLSFKFIRTHKNIYRNSGNQFSDLKFIFEMQERYGKFDETFKLLLGSYTLDEFENLRPKTTVFIRKQPNYLMQEKDKLIKSKTFINWMIKNKVRFGDYIDYKNMIEELGLMFNRSYLVFPKNFKDAHDEATKNLNALKMKQENEEYAERLKELIKVEREFTHYAFIIPKTLDELKNEGKALNHCVGSYINRHKTGEVTIIFVRDKDSREEPLYTLEIKKKQIVQFRGKGNVKAPEDAFLEAERFLSYCNKKKLVY